MDQELTVNHGTAVHLARKLTALTGDDVATVVVRALEAELARVRDERRREAVIALPRAIRRSSGPGIPTNHCWGI